MTRRRLAAVTVAAAIAGALGSAQLASADPAVDPAAVEDLATEAALQIPLDGVGEVDLYSVGQRYWACIAVDGVDFGLCLDNPLPDMSQLPSVPELLGQLGG